MIFGIVGTHCTGKTTFVQNFREANPDLPNVGYIHGDLTTDNYPLVPPQYRESKFFRKLEFKRAMLTDMIRDRSKLWIVEGCRFWGSMFHHLSDIVKEVDGGLFMVIVVTSPELMLQLMIQRAEKNERTLKVDYWDDKKLEYEAKRRHINACSKALGENDWVSLEFTGDFEMWDGEPRWLLREFIKDRSLWYTRFPIIGRRTPV